MSGTKSACRSKSAPSPPSDCNDESRIRLEARLQAARMSACTTGGIAKNGLAGRGMRRRRRRLILIGGGVLALAAAVALMLNAFRDSIVFFNSPSEVAEKHIPPGTRIRLGGLVKAGSLVRGDDLQVRFALTDGGREVAVAYQGMLPDLFREGQGVVAEGSLDDGGVFHADTVLAKHDETYMPKEVADALKKSGRWQP
jgi:cytochrome c-type biogenesis protein CcmE